MVDDKGKCMKCEFVFLSVVRLLHVLYWQKSMRSFNEMTTLDMRMSTSHQRAMVHECIDYPNESICCFQAELYLLFCS